GVTTVLSCCAGGIALDIYRKRVSRFHSYRGLFDQYIAINGLYILGKFARNKLEKDSKDYKNVQSNILLERLRANEDTKYGKDFKFSEIKSTEDFIKKHPLTRYSHFQPYIGKIADGEKNVLTVKDPVVLAVTSGTSGQSNILPMIKEQRGNFFFHGIATLFRCMVNAYPATKQLLQKNLKIFYTPKWRVSKSGIVIGPNSSSPTNSKSMLSIYSTPLPGFEIMTEPEALYVHLLFGLRDKYIGMMEANFVSLIYVAFHTLELEWQTLVNDIELGRVNPELNINDDVRAKLNQLLTPDPARANELRTEFLKGFDGIAKRIWPKLNFVLSVDTGSFEHYGKLLREHQCKGTPFYSPLYAATEGLIGVNIWPEREERRYILAPRSMFFEFIPVEHSGEDQPKTLLPHEVDVGSTYELVISNISGMWRYRFGDVVKIAEFYNEAPVIEFLYRQGQLLNIRGEKTSEKMFYKALTDAANQWPEVKVIDYCCAESVMLDGSDQGEENSRDHSRMPHYIVFIELKDENTTLTPEQKAMIDKMLCKDFFVYESFRKKGSIAPMDVHVVAHGTFLGLRNFMLETTQATSNQYKVPRVLRRTDAVEFMMKHVVK
ncbi:unnamed protein product, partial [Owenia fusiformis]